MVVLGTLCSLVARALRDGVVLSMEKLGTRIKQDCAAVWKSDHYSRA